MGDNGNDMRKDTYTGPKDTIVERVVDLDVADMPTDETVVMEAVDDGVTASTRVAADTLAQIKAGVSVARAMAQQEGDTVARRELLALIGEYGGLSTEQLRALVHAGYTKLALAGEDERTRLKALEDIAGLPAVALTPAYTRVGVQVNVGLSDATQAVLDKLDETEEH